MQKLTLLLILIYLTACSTTTKSPSRQIGTVSEWDRVRPPKLEVLKLKIIRGQSKKVTYRLDKLASINFEELEIFCAGKRQGFDIKDGILRSFVSYDYNLEENNFDCEMRFPYKGNIYRQKVFSVSNQPFSYPTKRLNVPKKHVDLAPKDLKRWLKEQVVLKKVYNNSIYNYALFDKPFSRPLKSKVTAVYGSKRVFNNKKKSWHSGVDLRARRPTRIPVINRGKVVLVKDLFFNGKTVIVDHGLGIFSMYCHMSSYSVNVGDMVLKSDILGKTGNTGRSNAPHLHWGMRVNGNWVDGLSFVKEGV